MGRNEAQQVKNGESRGNKANGIMKLAKRSKRGQQTYSAQVFGVLQLGLDAHVVYSRVQDSTEVPNDVLLGVQ
jgi:hypothetical protein